MSAPSKQETTAREVNCAVCNCRHLWSELRNVRVWPFGGEGPDLEIAECSAGNTLSREVQS